MVPGNMWSAVYDGSNMNLAYNGTTLGAGHGKNGSIAAGAGIDAPLGISRIHLLMGTGPLTGQWMRSGFRVWPVLTAWLTTEYNNQLNPGGFYTISAIEISNDDPCDAISIIPTECYSTQVFTLYGATGSGVPNPGCGTYAGGDVWFQVTVPANGKIAVEIDTDAPDSDIVDGWARRPEHAIYDGTCGALNLITCNSNSSYLLPGRGSRSVLDGLVPGSTLFIRVWENSNNDREAFRIGVFSDNTPPDIPDCPADISQSNDGGVCSADVTWTAPTATDNCTAVEDLVWGNSHDSGDTFPVGTTTVTYYVVDLAGDTAFCTFDVTVTDNENPTITCPGDVGVNNDAGNCSAVVAIAAPTTGDNCGVTLQTWSMAGATGLSSPGTGINDISGQTFNVGVTTVTYYIEDAAGNSAQCTFDVTVTDNENPTITCPGDVGVNNDAGNCSAVVAIAAPTTGDNCGVTLQTWSMDGATGLSSPGTGINDISGTTFNVGVTTVTYRVEDAAGNFAQCSFDVEVTDNQDPTISCPADVGVNNDLDQCDAVVNGLAPTATGDNCGVTLQTWTMVGATVGSSAATGINDISGTTFNVGVTNVTYDIEDAAGNTGQCGFTVTVVDNQAPTISCPGDVGVNNDLDQCDAVVNGLAPTATGDNCGVTLQTWSMVGATVGSSAATGINDISGTTFNVGVTTVTYRVEDAAGNFAECSFDVEVTDDQDPTISCPADVSVSNDLDQCDAVVNGLAPTATGDNCGVTLQTWSMVGATVGSSAATGINDISGTTFNVGVTTVTYRVEDAAGNFAECSFDVEVTDDQDPTISCPGDVSVNNDLDQCDAVVNGLAPTATGDNCGVTLQTWSMVGATVGSSAATGINDISGTTFNVGATTVTYRVEDAAGNFAECSFDVEVTDDQDPTISCPADVSVNNDLDQC